MKSFLKHLHREFQNRWSRFWMMAVLAMGCLDIANGNAGLYTYSLTVLYIAALAFSFSKFPEKFVSEPSDQDE